MPSPTSIGRAAEHRAAQYLQAQGFTILDQNWRNRWCELDLIAKKAGIMHFIEVKYRATIAYGLPAEYVGYDKAGRLMRAALAWNQAHHYGGPYQIDIVSVTGSLEQPTIEHLPNAITL